MSAMTMGWALGLALFVVLAVYVVSTVLKVRYDHRTKRAGVGEWMARHLTCPDTSGDAMHRRFARALFAEAVVMPSGRRCAYPRLTVRVSPEDRPRFDRGGDLEGLTGVGERWYQDHAAAQGWVVPRRVSIDLEADPLIRPGWIPAARGHGDVDGRSVDPEPERAEPPTMVSPVTAAASTAVTETFAAQWEAVERQVRSAPVRTEAAVVRADTAAYDAATQAVAVAVEATQAMGVSEEDLWLHHDGHVARLPRRSHTIVGRHPASPLPLTDPTVSTRHAAIRHDASGWLIKDLGSRNGTCVDGRRLRPGQWTELRSGSIIVVADELMSVRIASDTALAAGPSPAVRDT